MCASVGGNFETFHDEVKLAYALELCPNEVWDIANHRFPRVTAPPRGVLVVSAVSAL